MRQVKVAAIQMQCSKNPEENRKKAEKMIRKAAGDGANIILLPELFEREYFCQQRRYDFYHYAKPLEENEAVLMGQRLAKELGVVLPISFYEKEVNNLYNSIACIDANGTILGVYRKTHIPDDHYYQEKFYFTPGDTGFRVFQTRFGTIGVGICWDQWFPETARSMALLGAELLFYPTAIGSEPILECDSMPHWRRCMQGHSAANLMPVIAANRIGLETVEPSEENGGQTSSLTFYGSSFLTDETGELLKKASRDKEEILEEFHEVIDNIFRGVYEKLYFSEIMDIDEESELQDIDDEQLLFKISHGQNILLAVYGIVNIDASEGATSSMKITVIGKDDENIAEEHIEYINGQAEYNAEQTCYMPVVRDSLDTGNIENISEDVENYLNRLIEEYETNGYSEGVRAEEDWKADAADALEEQ